MSQISPNWNRMRDPLAAVDLARNRGVDLVTEGRSTFRLEDQTGGDAEKGSHQVPYFSGAAGKDALALPHSNVAFRNRRSTVRAAGSRGKLTANHDE
jgi:hypothetical protein